jgi:putative inorganic carbon (HCO3(-)) transporter
MESPDRRIRSGSGESTLSLLAVCTLIAAIGFTPWAWGTGLAWAQFVFRVLGLVALGVVALAYWKGAIAQRAWSDRASWSMTVLLAVSAISAVVSIHRGKSLEAMLNLLAITGLFLAAAMFARGARWLRSLALVQVLAALPVAALGIAQYFRPDLLPPTNSYPGRALGSFGQPNRLGGYLIAMIPVALALTFSTQDRTLRAALLVAVVALTMCLVLTFSRGAWLGLAASLIVLAAAFGCWPVLAPRGAMLAVAAGCLLLPALLFLPAILSRLAPQRDAATAWNLPYDPEREGSGAMRQAIWSGAIAAAAARPVTGFGFGAFREAFDRMKDDRMKRLEAEGARTADQAHNHYLELLAERGVLGLAAFLLVAGVGLAAALALAGSGASGAAPRLLALGYGCAVVALLAHALLDGNLSLLPHQTLLYADLGLLAAAAPATARAARRSTLRGLVTALVALGGLGLAGASYAASVEAAGAARSMREARPEQAAEALIGALRLAPWNDTYAVALAKAEESVGARALLPDRLRSAEAAYRHAIAANPGDPVTRQELARLYLSHPDVWGEGGHRAARFELEAALAQNPHYAEIRNDLGVALLRAGDRAGAEKAFQLAAQGRRGFVDPLLNLAVLALESGDREAARRWADEALTRAPESTRARDLAARLDAAPGKPGVTRP